MAMQDWWRPMTQEEDEKLVSLVKLECPNQSTGDCKEDTYHTTMCPNCKAYYEAGAGIFGITVDEYIKDTLSEMEKMKGFLEALEGLGGKVQIVQ